MYCCAEAEGRYVMEHETSVRRHLIMKREDDVYGRQFLDVLFRAAIRVADVFDAAVECDHVRR